VAAPAEIDEAGAASPPGAAGATIRPSRYRQIRSGGNVICTVCPATTGGLAARSTSRSLIAWLPSLPATSFAALGYGSNTIWIDPEHDLVVVWRWHQDGSADEFFKRILAAVKG